MSADYLSDGEKYDMAEAVGAAMTFLLETVRDEDVSTEDRIYASAVLMENVPAYLYED